MILFARSGSIAALTCFLALLGSQRVGAQDALPALPDEGGSVTVASLEPDERRSYSLGLDAGDVLEVVVEQDEIDVQLELFVGDEESPIIQINDYPWVWKEPETLYHVADSAAELRLVVRSTSTRGGNVELRVKRRGTATTEELRRAEAERLYASSRVSRNERGSDAVSESKVEAALRAAVIFEELSMPRAHAMAENHAGSLLHQLGRPVEAIAAVDRGIAIAKATGDRWAECDLRATRAEAVFVQSVDASIDELLAVTSEFSDDEAAPCLLAVMRVLVYDLSQQYQFDRAIELFDRALPLSHELDEPWERAGLFMNVGTSYLGKQDLAKAIDVFTRAKDAYEQLGDRRLAMLNLDNRNIAKRELGDLEGLTDDHDEVLAFLESQSELEDLAIAEVNYAATLEQLELNGEAKAMLERAAARSEAPLGARALAWRRLAGLEIELGNLDSARLLLDRAIAAHAELGYLLRQLVDDLMLGRWQAAAGQRETALATYRALARRTAELGLDEIELEARLAAAELQGEMSLLNTNELEQAVALSEGVRGQLLSDRFRSSFSKNLRRLYDLQLRYGIERLEQSSGSGSSGEQLNEETLVGNLFILSEQAKARSLRDFLSLSRADLMRTMDPDLAKRERDLLAEAGRLSRERRALLQARDSAASSQGAAASHERIEELNRELEDSELQLEILAGERLRKDPTRAALLDARPVDLASVRRALGGRTLLSYYVLDDRTLVFAVRSDLVRVYDLGVETSAERLEEESARLAGLLGRPGRSVGQLALRSHNLWRLLVEPVVGLESSADDGPGLVISPDGPLHSLPFEALVSAPPNSGAGWAETRFLLDDYEISYTPSAGILSLITERPPRSYGADLVAFAGAADEPGVSSPSQPFARNLGPLPDAPREVRAVAEALSSSSGAPESEPSPKVTTHVLLGDEARESVARSALATNARYLHFATHGVVDPDRDSESFLVLGGDDEHDGLLQLREIVRLQVTADLVALSACSTGVGTRKAGEGVLSLSRGFLFAGAASLLASLWEVADGATAELMVELYRRLGAGQTKAEALRGAKRLLRESSRHGHPYYWASFVLTGAPDSVERSQP